MRQKEDTKWNEVEDNSSLTSILGLKEIEEKSALRLQKLKEESKEIHKLMKELSTERIKSAEVESEMKNKELEEESGMNVRENDVKVNEAEEEPKSKTLEVEAEMQVKQLEEENDKLREEIRLLSSLSKYNDEDLERINEENYEITKGIRKVQAKIKSYVEVFECMESQRLSLLKLTDEMVSTINQASVLTGNQKKSDGENDKAKPPTKGNISSGANTTAKAKTKRPGRVTLKDDRNDPGTQRAKNHNSKRT